MNIFSEKLIAWYAENKRELPWRDTTDPYIIWISEIILQQTRVAQGYDYFLRFIHRFPNVTALAEAPEARTGVLLPCAQSACGGKKHEWCFSGYL